METYLMYYKYVRVDKNEGQFLLLTAVTIFAMQNL